MSTQEQANLEDDARDEQLISQAVSGEPIDPLADITVRPLEPGEKAEDAVDFEDIGDDDLAEDEEQDTHEATKQSTTGFESILDGDDQDEYEPIEDGTLRESSIDELFRDVPTSPVDPSHPSKFQQADMNFDFEGDEALGRPIGPIKDVSSPSPAREGHAGPSRSHPSNTFELADLEDPASEELSLQQRLFAQSRALFKDAPPAPPENRAELLRSLWPKFQEHTVPRFMELFPSKRARYIGKTPLKTPKPVLPTKLSLEIAADQEKSFLHSTSGSKRKFDGGEYQYWIVTEDPVLDHDASDNDPDLDSVSDEAIGGTSWQDFQVACTDWELQTPTSPTIYGSGNLEIADDPRSLGHDDLFVDSERPSAKVGQS